MDLLDSFQLCGAAGCAFARDEPAYDGRVLDEAREHKLLSLLFETINEHIIDISRRQLGRRSIQTVVQIGGHPLSDEHLVKNVKNRGSLLWLNTEHLGDEVAEALRVHRVDRWIATT